MSHFAQNIKLLRKRRNKTQDDLAFALNIKRSTLGGYENNIGQPQIETLICFSDYFKISIDTLLKVDLTKFSESQLNLIEKGIDIYIKGEKLRVLTKTIDSEGNENIELIPIKAHAGYTSGYSHPEFIKEMKRFRLPFLDKSKKYRSFQIKGDSMLPIHENSWIICEYVEDWYSIKNNQAYIVITHNEGIVFKVLENNIEKEQKITLFSLNSIYKPYSLDIDEIQEIWKFTGYISFKLPEPQIGKDDIIEAIKKLKSDIEILKGKGS
jgi:transcriptional regulator with XRE-family HTH domain